ncbi:MAG: hypothetical protein GX613_04695 [Chloroflexi bacterium]|nr:hypothetical protein [Chloroflexota bacterium]
MDNLGTLCLFGVLAMIALFLLPRLLSNARSANAARREVRTYNDPTIGSRASFGAPEQPTYDAPEIRSRSSFGGRLRAPFQRRSNRVSGQSVSQQPSSRRVDSPKIQSRAGFGRKRK